MTGFKPRLQHGYGQGSEAQAPAFIRSHEPMLNPKIIGTNKASKGTRLVWPLCDMRPLASLQPCGLSAKIGRANTDS